MAKKNESISPIFGIPDDAAESASGSAAVEKAKTSAVFTESAAAGGESEAKTVAAAAVVSQITIVVPVVAVVAGYAQRHIETKLEPAVAADFARVTAALREMNVKMPSGRQVTSTADAVRWLCIQISGELHGN